MTVYKVVVLFSAALIPIVCSIGGPTSGPSDAFPLQTAVIEARTGVELWDAVQRLVESKAPENPEVWARVATDRTRPWATRCYAMQAIFRRFLHKGDDLHEACKRLGITSWFQPSLIETWSVGQLDFELGANSTVFVVSMADETGGVKYGVCIQVQGKITARELASGVADGHPKVVITDMSPGSVHFSDMRIRDHATTAPATGPAQAP
jgi:hypothetical protein